MRDRRWIEYDDLRTGCRVQIDANKIEGESIDQYARHTPPGDRSGELWLPGRQPSDNRPASGVN